MIDQLIPYDANGTIDFSELFKLLVKLGFTVAAAGTMIMLIKRGFKSLKDAIE